MTSPTSDAPSSSPWNRSYTSRKAFELLREIGDDLRPLRTGQPVDGLQPGLGVRQQPVDETRDEPAWSASIKVPSRFPVMRPIS